MLWARSGGRHMPGRRAVIKFHIPYPREQYVNKCPAYTGGERRERVVTAGIEFDFLKPLKISSSLLTRRKGGSNLRGR